MSTIDTAHHQAMEHAQQAFVQRNAGDEAQAKELLERAFELERDAANLIASDRDGEPSRSIIHRSAAVLALQCERFREAEQLVSEALAGNPPASIADELRHLFEQIKFQMNWRERGLELTETEIELRIDGPDVGPGITASDWLVDRVEATEKLLTRTAERLRKMPWRKSGQAKAAIRRDFGTFLRYAREGSFGIKLQIGARADQLSMGMEGSVHHVIEDTLQCLELFAAGNETALHERIPQDAYRRNFVAYATQLQPDGKHVDFVSLTTNQGDVPKVVALRKQVSQVVTAPRPKRGAPEYRTLTGELIQATKGGGAGGEGSIHLRDRQGKRHPVAIMEGLADVVKRYWDDEVTITGPVKGGVVHLERVVRAED